MCGIAGFLSQKNEFATGRSEDVVRQMALALYHRGPDDGGAWTDENAGIALGFRRLAILDVSPRGHQPMFSAGGRYVIAFNGEVYNFRELRTRLEGLGHNFTSGTDTEVILAAAVQWGASEVPDHLQGMFAYALWDREQRVLYLARDRIGIKPLYYGWFGNTFLFGSELRALERHPSFDQQIDREALQLYLDFGYVPTPLSIYEGIRKLPPGTGLQVIAGKNAAEPGKYWDLAAVFRAEPWSGNENEAIEALEERLHAAVDRHMVSDVPLGALLSGGVDSSTVVALMCAKARGRVKTFSIGFAEKGFDESPYARAVARHLKTDHTELILTPQDALEVIPKLPEIYDEPFADSSQVPTYLVSRLARAHVTVALSGDGGDEFFGGYNRYRFLPTAVKYGNRLGKHFSAGIRAGLRKAGVCLSLAMPSYRTNEGLSKLGELIHAGSLGEAYQAVCRPFSGSGLVAEKMISDRWRACDAAPGLDEVTQLQLWDGLTYLPDDILTKVDRASMAVSLEARVPLLDDEVVRFAASLPLRMKIRGKNTKWLLRQVLYKHVPRELVERPKAGFAIPLAAWLRGPLRDWAESLLAAESIRDQGFFRNAAVQEEWNEFRAGRRANHHRIWAVLMFQAWRERRIDSLSSLAPEDYWQPNERFA